MCGRFTHKFTWRELHDLLKHGLFPARLQRLMDAPALVPSYNVAPTQSAPIVRVDGPLGDEATSAEGLMARWGFVPSWWKEEKPPTHTINARAEGVATSGMFRSALAKRRCLVPVSGFYEWQQQGDGPKVPHFIHRADGAPMLLAGLWEASPAEQVTFTIITTAAGPAMTKLHDRQPVILEPEDAATWLGNLDDDDPRGEELLQTLIDGQAEGVITAYPVSTRVNTPRNNSADLIERVG